MENTEKVISLLVGSECVDDKRETRIVMSVVLECLLRSQFDEVFKEINFCFIRGEIQKMIKIMEALLLSCPKSWNTIFARLEGMKWEFKECSNEQKSGLFFGICIASMLSVAFLHTQGKLTKQCEKLFFHFLVMLRGGSMSWIPRADSSLSGTLSNVSGVIVRLPDAGLFFKEIKSLTEPDGPYAEGEKQLIEELCMKRFVLLPVSEKLKICSSTVK